MTMEIVKLACDSKFWPLYEVENGKYKLNYNPSKVVPITDYLKPQGRYKHLFRPENRPLLDKIQQHVNGEWEKIVRLCDN
jgi:pyruvate ferredoxin oxidoreductase beta subunit